MAGVSSKTLLFTLFISLFIINLVQANYAPKMDCGSACKARCMLASRHKMCIRACGTCCARCNCVPPGTSGHQKECACYYNMTTHGGRRKCP